MPGAWEVPEGTGVVPGASDIIRHAHTPGTLVPRKALGELLLPLSRRKSGSVPSQDPFSPLGMSVALIEDDQGALGVSWVECMYLRWAGSSALCPRGQS